MNSKSIINSTKALGLIIALISGLVTIFANWQAAYIGFNELNKPIGLIESLQFSAWFRTTIHIIGLILLFPSLYFFWKVLKNYSGGDYGYIWKLYLSSGLLIAFHFMDGMFDPSRLLVSFILNSLLVLFVVFIVYKLTLFSYFLYNNE